VHVPDPRDQEVAYRYFKPFVERFKGCTAVLDVASGQGHFLDLMKEAGIPARGVELDVELSESCRDRGLEVEQGDFFEFLHRAKPGSFDGVHASHIIEHFAPTQVEELFRLVGPALKEGSLFAIITPNPANLRRMVGDFWRDPTHVRPYPASAIRKLLGRAGGWEILEEAEYTDRKPSLSRSLVYGLRNLFLGRYWGGDDLYVIARRVSD
jgi:O-antigen chain-terminating methyltransferase